MIRLNAGSGDHPAPGWVNVDTYPGVNPDVVASLLALPLADEVCARVYCGHVLEHLPLEDVGAALAEIRRVLAPGGELLVVGPDMDRATTIEQRRDIRCGGRRWPGDTHHWVCRESTLLTLAEQAGANAWAQPIHLVDGSWPIVSRVDWQCAVHVRW